MSAIFAALLACAAPQAPVDVKLEQVCPLPVHGRMGPAIVRTRAVVLIHGLGIHPLPGGHPAQAEFHSWQRPDSALVKALGKNADVFALAYGQNNDLDTICRTPALASAVDKIRFLGYQEIILVGHSAGGVLARLFIEDHPGAPVAKVVQICAPNLGSSLAKPEASLHKVQGPFLQSLTKSQRLNASRDRTDKVVPAHVQFLCVMGTTGTLGDGLVSCQSQWPPDLQRQGIPVVCLKTTHLVVMHSKKLAPQLAELIERDYPRWSPRQVDAARASIFHKASAVPARGE